MTGSGLKGAGGGGGGGAPQSSSSDFSSSESGEAARGTEFLIEEEKAGAIGAGGAGAIGELIVAEAGGGLGTAAEESIDVAGTEDLGKGGVARLPVAAGDTVLTLDAIIQSLARLYPNLTGRTYQRHFPFPLPPSVSSLPPASRPKIAYSHWAEEGQERAHGRRRMQPSCP